MIKLVFFGTPQIAIPSLEFFIKNTKIEVLGVVTQPDKPSGRGHKLMPPPVKVLAQENNIEVFQPISIRKDAELIEKLKSLKPDFFITVAFGQILSQEVIEIPKYGTINLHASLLPKHRGANPIQRAIVNGDKTTGVTTMLTSLGVDEGDILLKSEVKIDENINSLELTEILAQMGSEILYNSMKGILDNSISPLVQNHQEATHAKKFGKEDGLMDWNKPSEFIHNQVRGMNPWPIAYTFWKDEVLKISKTEKLSQKTDAIAGTITQVSKEGISVATASNDILIKKLKPHGKGEMDACAWANGARIKAGEILGRDGKA
jgi:methionyl-tRNA formyltransferase